jgi:tetratricopeptide (TPR) repeat protein
MAEFKLVKTAAIVGAAFLALGFAGAVGAQSQGGSGSATQATSGQSQAKPGASDQQTAPQAGTAPEDVDYKAFYVLKPDDFDQQIKLGEAFVEKYPLSKYDESVYSRMTQAYYAKQNFAKMYEDGDKALALNPDDVSVLVRLGWVTPHNNADPNDLDAEHKLQKAETELKHALDVLAAMPKPAAMTDDDFTKAKAETTAEAHSGLGLVYFRQGKYDQSVTELQVSTQGLTPDPTDLYVLGIDFNKLNKFNDAADAFSKCAAQPGQLQNPCKQRAATAKQQATAPAK